MTDLFAIASAPAAHIEPPPRDAVHDAGFVLSSYAPALVVQANGESGPILERLGFEALGTIRLLVDRL